MKILLTGVTGYIAKFLLPALKESKSDLYALVRSNSKIHSIKELFETIHVYSDTKRLEDYIFNLEPDVVIHLSGYLKIPDNLSDVNDLIHTNVGFSYELLDICSRLDSKRIIFMNLDSYSLNDESFISKRYPYYLSKGIFSDLIKLYSFTSRVRTINLKVSNVYGPNNKRSVMNQIIDSVSKKQEITIENPAKEVNFIFIDGVVRGIIYYVNYMIDKQELNFFEVDIISSQSIKLSNHHIKSLEINKLSKCI